MRYAEEPEVQVPDRLGNSTYYSAQVRLIFIVTAGSQCHRAAGPLRPVSIQFTQPVFETYVSFRIRKAVDVEGDIPSPILLLQNICSRCS